MSVGGRLEFLFIDFCLDLVLLSFFNKIYTLIPI